MPAFIASDSVTQALNGSSFTVADTSNYTAEGKGTFSARLLYVYLYNGSTIDKDGNVTATPTAIDFSFGSYPDDTITIPISLDKACIISLQLTSNNPQTGSVYTATNYDTFLFYLKQFQYSLCQYAAAQTSLLSNNNFFGSLSKLQSLIECAEISTEYSDIWNAQRMIIEAYKLKNNPANFN